jgi:hypothetical protein
MSVACSRDKPSPDWARQLEMRSPSGESIAARTADPAALSAFEREYASARKAPRPVFAKYLPVLGAARLLDILEETYPRCHAQAHDLGKALFVETGDVGTALRECDTRCTSGCMHGVLAEAFGNSSAKAITAKASVFCTEGEMARLHKPGNCAHGLGHALMFVMGGDVKRAVEACLGFAREAMEYYCATGVYMEKVAADRHSAPPASSVHHPCDSEGLFPTACYRYKGPELLQAFGGYRGAELECLRLGGLQRRGCFHGLGHASIVTVYDDPREIGAVCDEGTQDDRVVCLEGVIEKLAEYDEERAKVACAALNDEMRLACDQAVVRKMYSLDKPTLALYYDRVAVAKRREALTGNALGAEDGAYPSR